MIITVASYKGGVGKTTTAFHLAAYLNTQAPTLLLDGDPTKNAMNCASRRPDFPFRVEPVEAMGMLAPQFAHMVIDTGQRPSVAELAASAKWSTLLVIPVKPAWLDTNALAQTIQALRDLKVTNFRVLLTHVSPFKVRKAEQLRELLAKIEAPVFAAQIPLLDAYEKASTAGEIVSAATDKNGARAWAAYVAVGEELGL
jgi:chromosome partitioning protein